MGVCAALAVLLMLAPGCSNKAQRLYQRAEMLFSQGQPYMAALDYRRLVMEQPHSTLADDALYKLAYLYREDFASPPRAIQTYEYLAYQYPDSPYADDALLWILQIQGEQLKDAAGVRRTCEIVKQRFPDDGKVLASAQLQLVKTLFATGKYQEADREAQALMRAYPQQERQCSTALLIRARAAEKLGKPGDQQAVKLYEQIVAKYPQTQGAIEAKRSIGWTYYGLRTSEMAQSKLAKERAARLMSDVPAPPLVGALHLKPFAALSVLLAQRGIHAAPEELLIASGAAFAFVYDPDNPSATTGWLERGALTAAAEQYGFASNVWSAASADGSFASLVQAISQGQPVMVPQAALGNWMIVTGYKPAEERLYVLLPGQPQAVALTRDQFLTRWASSTLGHTPCVTGPYFQFSLGDRVQPPTATAVLRNVARHAVEAMNQSDCGGAAAGEKAYALLAEQLENLQGNDDARKFQRLRGWASTGLPQLLAERRAAAVYLEQAGAATGGGTAEHARQAGAATAEMVQLGIRLQRELLSLLKPAQGAEPPPEAAWPEVAERVRQMQQADQKALSHLAEIAR
jgi:TolA-binding protein